MELGWLDTCIRVSDVARSRAFYEALGLKQVEGKDDEGWAVMVRGDTRIGLFEPQFMSTPFSLNFRGGDVLAIAAELERLGYSMEKAATKNEAGASASLKDPDGTAIFFDTATNESKRMPE